MMISSTGSRRPFEETTSSTMIAPLTKRSRINDKNTDQNYMIVDCYHSTTTTTPTPTPAPTTTTAVPTTIVNLPSQDQILIDMIQHSGATSYSDIVQFCLSTGIPMSRMLQLDLMRIIDKKK
jgi:hypothetical protein